MLGMAKRKPKKANGPPLTPGEIRKIRLDRELTQAQAAKMVGVLRESWAAWETGARKPSSSLTILIRLLAEEKI